MQISITFSTLAGRRHLILPLEDALKTEVADQVRHLVKINQEDGAVGAQFNLPSFGKVNIDIIDSVNMYEEIVF